MKGRDEVVERGDEVEEKERLPHRTYVDQLSTRVKHNSVDVRSRDLMSLCVPLCCEGEITKAERKEEEEEK